MAREIPSGVSQTEILTRHPRRKWPGYVAWGALFTGLIAGGIGIDTFKGNPLGTGISDVWNAPTPLPPPTETPVPTATPLPYNTDTSAYAVNIRYSGEGEIINMYTNQPVIIGDSGGRTSMTGTDIYCPEQGSPFGASDVDLAETGCNQRYIPRETISTENTITALCEINNPTKCAQLIVYPRTQ